MYRGNLTNTQIGESIDLRIRRTVIYLTIIYYIWIYCASLERQDSGLIQCKNFLFMNEFDFLCKDFAGTEFL